MRFNRPFFFNFRTPLANCLTRKKTQATPLGSIIWDPYTKQKITKLESIQRRGARFITKDYKSREEGCMTKMLNELNLPTLQSRRQKQRLIFFYKVVEGQVPAMPPDQFVKYQKSKRQIRAKRSNHLFN